MLFVKFPSCEYHRYEIPHTVFIYMSIGMQYIHIRWGQFSRIACPWFERLKNMLFVERRTHEGECTTKLYKTVRSIERLFQPITSNPKIAKIGVIRLLSSLTLNVCIAS